MKMANSDPNRKNMERQIAQLNVGRRNTANIRSGRSPRIRLCAANPVSIAPPARRAGTHQAPSQKWRSPSDSAKRIMPRPADNRT